MSDDEQAVRTEDREDAGDQDNSQDREDSKDRDGSGERGNSEGQTDSPVDEEDVEAAKEETRKVEERYEPGARPTVVVEGTGGTVAGTAFASDEEIEKHQAERSEPEET